MKLELSRLNGLHVGLLDPEELEEFERLVAEGRASRSYEGAAGLLGIAKVRVFPEILPEPEKSPKINVPGGFTSAP